VYAVLVDTGEGGRMSDDIEWVGPRPEDRRQTCDYCKHCGVARGADVLNYRGPCQHEFERIVFVPERVVPGPPKPPKPATHRPVG
jgi:hypothetical protein